MVFVAARYSIPISIDQSPQWEAAHRGSGEEIQMALPSGAIQGLPSPADIDAYKTTRTAREIVATSVQSHVERMPSEESTEVRLLAGNGLSILRLMI